MQRRDFITLLGGAAAAWPIAARAQQPALPIVGWLGAGSPEAYADKVLAFRKGVSELGFVEGRNVMFTYRWAEGQYDRLPALAADLVRRPVAAILASGGPAAKAAKEATPTIPIVFLAGYDPVETGLVTSLARPGGNITGWSILDVEVGAKRLGLLRELLPAAARAAVLVNPANATNTSATLESVEPAARALGLQIQLYNASSNQEINAAFSALVRERPDALFVGPDVFFTSRRVQLTHLATRYMVPATYSVREFVEAGGLLSYGANLTDMYRQVGAYTGRILKGAKPADLPVVQSTKSELVINLQAARLLGLTVPPSLLAIADEVIE
jgi:putative ABC transport system substrate-binding protein